MGALLWGVVVFLVVVWLILWLIVHVGSGLIHLLLLLALIVLVYNLITGARSRRTL